jgi:hypothetical protein
MKIKDLVVVTGMPGIQKIAANRNNGMLVEDIDTGVVRFAPIRKHQFSPLESISIYTDDNDAVELRKVLQSMQDKLQDNPLPSPDAKPDELRSYFNTILANHDRDKVHISDIKKIIRWFQFLNERGILAMEEESEEKEDSEKEEEN